MLGTKIASLSLKFTFYSQVDMPNYVVRWYYVSILIIKDGRLIEIYVDWYDDAQVCTWTIKPEIE